MMDGAKEIRWKQRFSNYEKAVNQLNNAVVAIENPTEVERAGVIQFFEIAFELAWKTIKDYLQGQGFADVKTPRDSLKQAFQVDLIKNGHAWIEMLDQRNRLTHTYNEIVAAEAWELITKKYLGHMLDLFSILKSKL